MSDLDESAVTVSVGDDGYLTYTTVEREDGSLVEGVDMDDMELGPARKRLRLDDIVAHTGNHIITQESDMDEGQIIHDDSQIIQEQELQALSDGNVVIQGEEEEVIQHHQLPAPQYQNLIIQHMDIAEPLVTLKQLLELRLQCSLADHQFYLQDSIPLDTRKSLVDQCVQGEGMVQINLEVKSQPDMKPKINILDILKPAEEVESNSVDQSPTQTTGASSTAKVVVPAEEQENITRWIVDQHFRKEQERLKIPYDPMLWSAVHVKHWIMWAINEFKLEDVDVNNFNMTGFQLCELTHSDFVKYIPHDPGDIFWTHLELLRKCKFVAVMQQPAVNPLTTINISSGRKTFKQKSRSPRITGDHGFSPGNRTGNNGQIQLWQFLLELLTDKDCREVIQWVGEEGEFKLNNPEMVAQMWGNRKNKPTMNYEKLSRALRYYYDGDMIAKVHGKRFVYKFVCDLKMLLGYSASELNRQVTMCAEKKLQRVRETLRPTVTSFGKQKLVTHTVQTTLD
ncbi:GA-binding protein alpha chain-like [Dreissena polymorpha]|uniref:GA-binding protein alpha chain n=1 Tax=Dreissena polymorpha TaxID=45954 RepID=A0A9D3YML2_DREPO|nr:GA-binding protein alpha chain-like [Dreissena polymorpha]XP_052254381.1 GA-binding protein alpha chain-like [Dreissena polymorpha]XP_052254382.1 GA-binding protein alpha chain-like [Dreissena polymorpha]KAH3701574.1 hypothetical protein DPMN_076562 [Dreissena polymorpha]